MKKVLLLIVPTILLTSCAAKITQIAPQRRAYTTEKIDEVLTKEIGESLIIKGDEEVYKAMKIVSSPEGKVWQNDSYTYNVGDVFPLMASNNDYDLYFTKSSVSESNSYYKGNVYTTFSFYGVCAEKKDPKKINPFIRQTTGALGGVLTHPEKGFKAEPTEYINMKCESCFKKELVFNGKTGNSLKFMYREYVEDLARPAFTQELQYDLAEGSIIGIKGLRIEVIRATNISIEYKILKTFD